MRIYMATAYIITAVKVGIKIFGKRNRIRGKCGFN